VIALGDHAASAAVALGDGVPAIARGVGIGIHAAAVIAPGALELGHVIARSGSRVTPVAVIALDGVAPSDRARRPRAPRWSRLAARPAA
jgi:hypothetical protein